MTPLPPSAQRQTYFRMHPLTRQDVGKILLIATFTIVLGFVINILSEGAGDSLQQPAGEGYKKYLWAVLVLSGVLLTLYTTDIGHGILPGSKTKSPERYNIPPGPKSRKVLEQAKTEIEKGEPGEALRQLSDLKSPTLGAQISLLGSQLANLQRTSQRGTIDFNTESRAFQRIASSTRDLITALEAELNVSSTNDITIRDYLKKRYTNRLDQKLAKRQPVNLRRLVNKDVVPEDFHPAFVSYSSDEISGAILQTFREAQGRLLLVGAPGAGKTTLMLQLVLDLLESEHDAMPVLLNLATWSKEFITLEAWLKKILPAEIGTSNRYGTEIIQQNNHVFLFDGFDEIREADRFSFLEALNRYSSDGQQYVISSRKQEFKDANKGILIHLSVEVCPLSFDQLKSELLRLRNDHSQSERGIPLLLDAVEKDILIQESVQSPFYFNALQFLFNRGIGLSDMQFKSDTTEGRHTEIKKCFIEYAIRSFDQYQYNEKDAKHWLSFLSSRMAQRNIVAFELRDLQYNWGKWSTYELITWRIFKGIVDLLPFAILSVFFIISIAALTDLSNTISDIDFRVKKLVIGAFSVFILLCLFLIIIIWSIVGKHYPPKIMTHENIDWSWKNIIGKLKLKLISNSNQFIFIVAIVVLIDIFTGIHFLLIFVLGGLLINLVFFMLLEIFYTNTSDILQITSPYHRFNASRKALHFSILQHKHLCSLLRKRNLLPPDLPQFLNEMSLRHILEFDGDPKTGTGGGSWRFRHRILQEYFAEKWVEEN